ncbi:MAG TPA: hypothetical protein VGE26_04165 [Sphingobacteriaceae bacterium]
MKRIFFIAALLVSVFSYANAQGQGGRQMGTPEERAQRQAKAMTARLELSEEQQAKVQDLFLIQAKRTDSLRNAAQGDFQAMRGKIRPIQEETDKKIISLLNEEQKKKFQSYQEERKNRMQGGGRRPANNRK